MTTMLAPSKWMRKTGRLDSVSGRVCATVEAGVGELVEIDTASSGRVLAEVIGFDEHQVQLMPFESVTEFHRGALAIAKGSKMRIGVGPELLGRVVDVLGRPMDGLGPIACQRRTAVQLPIPDPMKRRPIDRHFETGLRAIDGVLTLGCGQRVGLFAGSGVGKSTLLGEIARHAEAEINVVAMIGERGREVRPFIEESLGPDGLRKSVVIVSTSDEPPLARVRAAESAVAIASYFRSQGKNVMLMLDSITRFAHAARELGLLLGEPPSSRGYTPSVFQRMARLLEQLGNNDEGSITAILTVLVDGDDMNDPVADAARSILDGHIVLDRKLAHRRHFPAINVLTSASRVFEQVAGPEHIQFADRVRKVMAKYQEVEDLVQIGAYKRGANPESDRAIDLYPDVCRYLQQGLGGPVHFQSGLEQLAAIGNRIGAFA